MPVATTKAAPRKPIVQPIEQLANNDEAIHVRNTLSNIAVLTLNIAGNQEISEFAAKGDAQGQDVMELPSTYLKNAQFRNQLQKGIFEIIDADNPAVLSAFQAQRDSWKAQQAAKEESDRFIEMQQPRAFSGHQCLAQEGKSQCTEFAISANNNRERPPLCSKHAHLASQYVAEENGQFQDNKPVIDWVRVQTTR